MTSPASITISTSSPVAAAVVGVQGPSGPSGAPGAQGPAGPSTTPGGLSSYVQFNDGGSFNGTVDFAFDKTNRTLRMGQGTSVIAGGGSYGSVAFLGDSTHQAVATGDGSFSAGAASTSTGTFAHCLGPFHSNPATAGTCIGEENTNAIGAANAVNIGFSNSATQPFAVVVGASAAATAIGAVALGLRSGATRTGQMGHAGGQGTCQGGNWIDLYADLNAVAGKLQTGDPANFSFTSRTLVSCFLRLWATTPLGTKRAYELHALSIWVGNGVAITIDDDTIIAPAIGARFAAQGWSITFGTPGTTGELSITLNPGTDHVRCAARLDWGEIFNV